MKKFLSITLILCMVLGIMPITVSADVVDSGTCGENLTWELDSEGTLTISGTGDMDDYGIIFDTDEVTPASIEGSTSSGGSTSSKGFAPWSAYEDSIHKIIINDGVTSVGHFAFAWLENMEDVSLPETITQIGIQAFFGCSSLAQITIPASVSKIKNFAFSDCASLVNIYVAEENANFASVDGVLVNKAKDRLIVYPCGKTETSYIVPDTVTLIGEEAFYKCVNLQNVKLPDALKIIGAGAFSLCSGLETVNIPESVEVIDHYAFSDCISLNSIAVPKNVKSIGHNALYNCPSLNSLTVDENNTNYMAEDNVLFNKAQTILYTSKNTDVSYKLPKTVEIISQEAFFENDYITEIILPDGLKYIEEYAFSDCVKLKSVSIPESVIQIGNSAFVGCSVLEEITLPNKALVIGENAFLYTAYYNEEDNWEDNVLYINNHLIEASGLSGTYEVKENTLTIGTGGFLAQNVTEVILPDTVEYIGESAFCYCSKLKGITIPKSVKTIDSSVFDNCENLTDVYYSGSEEDWKKIDISNTNEGLFNATIHYASADVVESGTCGEHLTWTFDRTGTLTISGTGDMEDYPAVTKSPFYDLSRQRFDGEKYVQFNLDRIIINEGVSSIGENAFKKLPMTSVDMPDSINSIGRDAFHDCVNLKEVSIPDKVTCINRSAFEGCTSLVSVALPHKLEIIGDSAFASCSKLTSITIPDSVNTIEMWAFSGCSRLTSISIPDGITLIDKMTFNGCSRLIRVTIPKSITTIEELAFDGCKQLADIYYEGTKEEFANINIKSGNDAFVGANVYYNCVSNMTVDAVAKKTEKATYVEVTLGENNNTKRLFVDGQELYYSVQRGMYVGLVPGDNVADNKLTDVVIADAEPTTFVYGNVDGKDDFTSFEDAIKNSDLLNMKLYLAGANQLETKNLIAADLNGDGKCTTGDILALKVYMTNGTQFPILR